MNLQEKEQARQTFVGKLLACLDDDGTIKQHHRGDIAGLKMFLRSSDTSRNRALPAFGKLAGGDLIDDIPAETVAAFFALHPHRAEKFGDFGTTCSRLANEFGDDAFQPHFERLLAARTRENAAGIILRLAQMARSKKIPVNYYKLAEHLALWNQEIRIRWARSFYQSPAPETP